MRDFPGSRAHEVLAPHLIDGIVIGWQRRLVYLRARVMSRACTRAVPPGRDAQRLSDPWISPPSRGPVEVAISRVDRRIVLQHILQHVKVAVEPRPMPRHGAVLRQRRYRKTAAEHALTVATLLLRAASAT